MDEEEVQKYIGKDGVEYELHGKQFHKRIDPKEDLALKNYIEREQQIISGVAQDDQNYERAEKSTDQDTVYTKSVNSSVLTKTLNIVKEQNSKK